MKEAGFNVPNVPQARGIVGPPDMPADVLAFYEDLMQRLVQSDPGRNTCRKPSSKART